MGFSGRALCAMRAPGGGIFEATPTHLLGEGFFRTSGAKASSQSPRPWKAAGFRGMKASGMISKKAI